MKWFRLMYLAALAGQLVLGGAAADRAADTPEGMGNKQNLPPVLRTSEPPDSGLVTLPGPPPVTPVLKLIVPIPPVARFSPSPTRLIEDAVLQRPVPLPVVAPAPVKASPLPNIASEVAVYCQKQIGHWKQRDARELLGEPRRQRPAYDEYQAVNGTIYAFPDPTSKYKEVELDFDRRSGNLRTVFAYPTRLTWEECRRRWSGPVQAADAARGRKFYSYTNRRLDVLVDHDGRVISLGWY